MRKVIFIVLILIISLTAVVFFKTNVNAQSSSCTAPTNTGRVTLSTTTTSGTYRVWARVKAGNIATNDSFYIQIDSGCPILVGNSGQISSTAWTWVDYSGTTSNKVNTTLTSGNHVVTLIGNETGVAVDKILLTKNTSCIPTGFGDNCPAEVSATPTPTKAPTLTPTKAPTPTPTKAPTPTPTKTPTPTPGPTVLNFQRVNLHGIGLGGTNVNPTDPGTNSSPLTPTRSLTIEFFNSSNNLVKSVQGNVNYSTTNRYFSGSINVSGLSSGSYIVKVKTHKYLRNVLSGIVTITAGTVNAMPQLTLVAGDVNSDGVLSILDWNITIGCYSDILPATNCDAQRKFNSDLNDDGLVNQFDINLWIGESSVFFGN